MASYSGFEGTVKLGATGGTAVVAEVVDFTHDNSMTTVKGGACNDAFVDHKPGPRDGAGTITVRWDPDDTAGQAALITAFEAGTQVELNLYPAGATVGKLSGMALINNNGLSGGMESMVDRKFSYVGYLTEAPM